MFGSAIPGSRIDNIHATCVSSECAYVLLCMARRTFSNSLPPFGDDSAPAALQDFNMKPEKEIDTVIDNTGCLEDATHQYMKLHAASRSNGYSVGPVSTKGTILIVKTCENYERVTSK